MTERDRHAAEGDRDAEDGRDAIVVGSGPNGLAAAIALARAGRSVRVYESEETVGGGARTAELTLPGFRHDVCSAIHALALASPFLRSLPLADHGLELVHPPVPFAHPLGGGRAAVLERSVEATAEGLGSDGRAYRRFMGPLVEERSSATSACASPWTTSAPATPPSTTSASSPSTS